MLAERKRKTGRDRQPAKKNKLQLEEEQEGSRGRGCRHSSFISSPNERTLTHRSKKGAVMSIMFKNPVWY